MKKFYFLLAIVAMVLATACEKDSCEQSWTQVVAVPVTLDRTTVQNEIEIVPAMDLCLGGGIYAYGDFIFMNRLNEGYHILDNSNPEAPQNVAFLKVPGATQMSFVDGKLVSNCYADLVTLELDGILSARLLSSTPNFLLDENTLPVDDGLVVVGYEDQSVEFTQSCDGSIVGQWQDDAVFISGEIRNNSGGFGFGTPSVNTAGSMSRMAFNGNLLYVIGTSRLSTYSLQNNLLVNTNNQQQSWGMETVVVRGNFLYIGSQSGMHIYNLNDAQQPAYLSTFVHFTGCDPVSVVGNIAVVTVRDGRSCGSESGNVMFILDISDKSNPTELTRVNMNNPRGVALYNGYIYLCDGDAGLKVYDLEGGPVTSVDQRQRQVFNDDSMTDVAVLPYPAGDILLTVGDDHLSQFSISTTGALAITSRVAANTCIQP
ncbi:MAG: LVIVD repeat-containing protein [Saprospiraceae bacterium]